MPASFEIHSSEEDSPDSTHDSEGLLNAKERQYLPHKRSCLKMNYFYWALFAFSILVNITLVWHSILVRLSIPTVQVATDVHGVSPIFSTKQVVFEQNNSFLRSWDEGSKNEDNHDAWLSILPRGMGWITLRDSPYPRLPEPVIQNGTAVYASSMTHQLHCLYMIMSTFNTLARGEAPPLNASIVYKHIDHCFDYIRQATMCCGDTALEGQSYDPHTFNATDGWGFTHVCKDYGEVIGYMEGWRHRDLKEI